MDLRTDDFDYTLPVELIAQEPARRREDSRLMVLDRAARSMRHERFADIGRYLASGDVLVANRSKVIPARLQARKFTGGAVELLLIRALSANTWVTLARPSRKLRAGMTLSVCRSGLVATLRDRMADGQWLVRFDGPGDVEAQLRQAGTLPLPPYIHNPGAPLQRYQTVYADREGSIAAPTAGLHFSPRLIRDLAAYGVRLELVTLHVGLGTFKPVTVERVTDHQVDAEWGMVPAAVAAEVNRARRAGRRAIAVGTTTTRLLESAARNGTLEPFCGEADLFIHPGHTFQAIDGLITNFHLPRSTLLMLVSAFAGRDLMLEAYRLAIDQRYRFYSFGDAMLIL